MGSPKTTCRKNLDVGTYCEGGSQKSLIGGRKGGNANGRFIRDISSAGNRRSLGTMGSASEKCPPPGLPLQSRQLTPPGGVNSLCSHMATALGEEGRQVN